MSAPAPRIPEEHVAALVRVLRGAGLGPREETAPLARAGGRRTSRRLTAPHPSPRFDNSQMDGYAVAARDLDLAPGPYRVGPTLPAGTPAAAVYPRGLDEPGVVAPVMTGAQLPDGAGAVVPVERAEPARFLDPGASVRLPRTEPGTFLRPAGSDLPRGAELLPAGTVLGPVHLALAASQGLTELPVAARPRVLVVTGGEEVLAPGPREPGDRGAEEGGPGEAEPGDRDPEAPEAPLVPDANGPLLRALAAAHGIEVAGQVHTGDDPATLARALRAGIARHAPDLVITSGGISHGRYEVVRQVLAPTPESWFGHVSQQPGGPQGHAVFDGVPVLCLPGNPVSTLVSFRVLVLPALAAVCVAIPEPRALTAVLTEEVEGIPGRTRWLRARLRHGLPPAAPSPHAGRPDVAPAPRADAAWREAVLAVTPTGGPGSHLLGQAASADALLEVPPRARLRAGQPVRVLPLEPVRWEPPAIREDSAPHPTPPIETEERR
ncbi:hypothetical protein BK826_07820 [Rothia kristinae]|uniref:Molybdopterin molybdenumtransferase n=1 Tax=Rothia kristinae TaxID=37923 RepID=A0A1S2MYJ3_9MICC|nr:molybdopterin molybdotransferase MoeA [Rothia kristinae]OIJ35396.1 hypothetical protein BK826_07820 [Rothia kristinae]